MDLAVVATKDDVLHVIEFNELGDLQLELSKMDLPIVVLPLLNLNDRQVSTIKELVQEDTYQGMAHFIEHLVLVVEEVSDQLQI